MGDNNFLQFRVSKLHEMEVEKERADTNTVTLFLESAEAYRIALQIPMTMLPEIVAALEVAMRTWPGGHSSQ